MSESTTYEPLPLVGAQLVKLRFCGNGKDSGVTIETSGNRTAVIHLSDARMDLSLAGPVSITTKGRGDTAIVLEIAPTREQCVRIEEAAIAFPGGEDDLREILQSYERTGTLGWAGALRLKLVATENHLQHDADQPLDAAEVDDAYRDPPLDSESPQYIDPETSSLGFQSPPGTPYVTSEDVKRWLEDFP